VARWRSAFPGRSAGALVLTCALVLAFGSVQAQAAPKGVVDFFGSAGTGAEQFATPTGMAVNQATGDLYVVDSGNNRVQQFDAMGNFVRAWGWDVEQPAAALGAEVFEVCNAPSFCKQGVAGAGAGQFSAAQGIAVDQATGDVYVTNQGNRRVEKFGSTGNFLFAFGWNVDPAGGTELETCTVTCQQGASGSGSGQFGTSMGHPAVDPRNGDVVVADRSNRRVQKFNSAGAFLMAFGSAGSGVGQFGSNQPARVAVDSSGSIYTVESTSTPRRVQKFSPSGTSAAVFAPDQTSGTSNATASTDVAVDPANDNVLVAKDRQVLEFNLAGVLTDTHAAGAGLPAANGLAVDSSNGRIYISTTPDQRVFVLGTVTPPSATIAPASDITATSATLNGTVNPNGGGALSTGYHFEYSDDGGASWTPVPVPDQDVGNGTVDVPVSQPVSGLEPNTEYRVRLVASRPFAGGSATSNEATFTTDAAPPSISAVGVREVTDTTAILAGRIDPNRSHTTYRFEYGTDTSYGNATAVDNAGSGATPVPVSKAVTGLQPGTTYHFRLIATSAAGETAGADQTFTTAATPPQPSGRVYEMVSPLDKNGGNIERDFLSPALSNQSGAAASGDAVAFTSRLQFGNIESGPVIPTYVARRGATGWSTEGVTPPIGNTEPGEGVEAPVVMGLSLDLSKAFVRAVPALAPGAERLGGSSGLYMRRSGEAERYALLSSPWTTLGTDTNQTNDSKRFEYVADTPDSSQVVFNSHRQLLPDAPEETSPLGSGSIAVYEWVDGSLRLVSVPPPGVPEFDISSSRPVAAGARERGVNNSRQLPGDHVISDDGRRVFFTAPVPAGGRQLFVREDATTTVHVSRSERPGDPQFATTANPMFWAANSTDGSVAFFTAQVPLTEDAATGTSASLYRWDANAPEGQRLSLISLDPLGAPGVLGPAAVNDDATSVAFVAEGLLDPDATGAIRGRPNLYLWRQGEGVRYVATLDGLTQASSRDVHVWKTNVDDGGPAARISADGERVLFASFAQLDPDYDTTEETPEACGDPSTAGETCRQIHLYDSGLDETTCLTCVPGVPITGNSDLFGRAEGFGAPVAPYSLPRNLSADGTQAFFETPRALVSADTNSAIDVYEWEDRDLDGQGELRLISPGRGTTDSLFVDANVSGDDVFFTTREQLVGIDTDNLIDLYDARVGGGIPAQNPPPVSSCQGDECQGSLSGAPSLPGVGSGGASNGDASPGPRPSFSVARLSRAQLARLARGRPIALRVRVNQAGRVALIARAKLGKRMRTVAGDAKRARRAGTVKLGLKLSRIARRELARERRLNVKLTVRFAGVREARTSMLRLRRARSSGERGAR
jgi:DNA-binding beta-propeller fold protein YncE